jgi:hypothetical protein
LPVVMNPRARKAHLHPNKNHHHLTDQSKEIATPPLKTWLAKELLNPSERPGDAEMALTMTKCM